MSQGLIVNSEVGGYAYGAIVDAPFGIFERVIQTGVLGARNVAQLGVYPNSDTFDFWWSKRVTGYSQDNLIWAFNLLAGWYLSVYPTKDDSYLRRWAAMCGKNKPLWLSVRLTVAAVPILIGYSAIWPDDPVSVWWRGLTRMPSAFVIQGVN
jgi:hypothetical protein